MKIKVANKFLHVTAIGTLILGLITGGLLGLVYCFIFGLCLGQLIVNGKRKKNEEL